MQQRISDMINEKQGLTTLNAELQKKAVALIAKEKAMQGQTAAARTAAEVCLQCSLLVLMSKFSPEKYDDIITNPIF